VTAQDLILEIESLPQEERTKVEAWLRSQDDAREEALDVALLKERASEPSRDFRVVLSDLGINPE
jgi:hypothetical protein